MGRIFDPENGFFQTISQLTDVALLSGAWVVCSLPLVTIGPATAALYYAVVKCVRRREPRALGNFWSAFKANLKTGAAISLLAVPLILLLMWGRGILAVVGNGGDAVAQVVWVAYTVGMVVPLGVFAWAFPLISRFIGGPGQALGTAFRLCLRHLPTTLWSVLLLAVFAGLSLRFWFIPLWLLCPGVWALLSSFPMERVFRKYTSSAEGMDEEDKPWYLK